MRRAEGGAVADEGPSSAAAAAADEGPAGGGRAAVDEGTTGGFRVADCLRREHSLCRSKREDGPTVRFLFIGVVGWDCGGDVPATGNEGIGVEYLFCGPGRAVGQGIGRGISCNSCGAGRIETRVSSYSAMTGSECAAFRILLR